MTVDHKGKIAQRKQRRGNYRRESLGKNLNLDLVIIPGGLFTMGSPISEAGRDWYSNWDDSLHNVNVEGPQHEVRISPFLMGKYPVTQAQWRAVAALPKVDCYLDSDPSHFNGDDRPVERVSWDEAVEFCRRISEHTGREYRLPSEAEWEYACRAGTITPFHFGETLTSDLANYNATQSYNSGPQGKCREQTTKVGSFPANAFGLHDMHGNVWEWCLDHWHETYENAPTDGSAWLSSDDNVLRLLRGGSWYYNPVLCRSAYRNWNSRSYRFTDNGFRVAGTVT